MSQYRLLKISEQLKAEIANMILQDIIKDPRVSKMLVITQVEITRDLKFAKVFVSSFLSETATQKGVEGLQNAKGFIQSTLAKKLSLRQFPHLTFVQDSSIKEGMEMIEKLDNLATEQNQKTTQETTLDNLPPTSSTLTGQTTSKDNGEN